MGMRGRQPLGLDVELKLRIPTDLSDGLDQLAELTHVSKASLVRLALMDMVGMYQEEAAMTRTAGPRRRRQK